MGIPRDQRLCKRRLQDIIEDGKYLLFECPNYIVCREIMMNIILYKNIVVTLLNWMIDTNYHGTVLSVN